MEDSDQQAFVAAITDVQRDLYAYILTLLPRSADADDVLQEANRVLWTKRHDFEPGTNFRAWAYTIARYQVLSFRKPRAVDRLIFSDAFVEQMAEEVPESLEPAASRLRALKVCMEKLSADDERLVNLRYLDGLLAPEIARRLNRSAGSIRQALFRLRQGLMRCIERRMAAEERE